MTTRIRVNDVSKAFRIPVGAPLTLKQRILHPLQRTEWREFQALQDVSFSVEDGEFFGIVGRNGCGKSTLLKLLSGIYFPEGGRVDVRGSVAPLIELGVGFNHELSARDNVFINGTLLGLTSNQLRAKLDEIIEFAELDGFMDLKLRNFSSGMVVRLAFAVAIHAAADILLVDEVLAVGDERFQQKCFEVFRQRRAAGQTVVFVSHDMDAMQQFCHRAVLLEQGKVLMEGDPRRIARAYRSVNAGLDAESAVSGTGTGTDATLLETKIIDRVFESDSEAVTVPAGELVRVEATWQVDVDVVDPIFSVGVTDKYGQYAVRANTLWSPVAVGSVRAGDTLTVAFEFENRLAQGRYDLALGVATEGGQRVLAVAENAGAFMSETEHDTGAIYDPVVRADVSASGAKPA